MWNSFKKALETRVRSEHATMDPHFVQSVVRRVIEEMFGKIGLENVKIDSFEGEIIKVKITNSVWAGEIRMRKKNLIGKINGYLGKEQIKEIIIFKG